MKAKKLAFLLLKNYVISPFYVIIYNKIYTIILHIYLFMLRQTANDDKIKVTILHYFIKGCVLI